jgi:hypothetical protein
VPIFFAHTGLQRDQSDWQKLADHLIHVAAVGRDRAQKACLGYKDFGHHGGMPACMELAPQIKAGGEPATREPEGRSP